MPLIELHRLPEMAFYSSAWSLPVWTPPSPRIIFVPRNWITEAIFSHNLGLPAKIIRRTNPSSNCVRVDVREPPPTLMPNTEILEWPVELIELVLVNLHPLHVMTCRQVCKFLSQLIDSSIELQLRIELAQDGHIIKHRGNGPAISLRERVLLHRRALEIFKPKLSFKTVTPGFWVYRYDISDGMIGSLAAAGEPALCRITYHELACPEGHQRWQQTWDFPDMKIVDLSFWGVQDLQILTEECENGDLKRLHFRTMSTNAPHPLAALGYFDLREPEMPVDDNSFTVMHEDILMVIFKPDESEFDGKAFAMNWKTGEIVLGLRDASDATFIAKDLILISINALDIEDGPNGIPSFEIFSLTAQRVLYRCNLPFDRPTDGISFINNQNFAFDHNRRLSQPKEFIPDFDLNILAVVVTLETHIRLIAPPPVVIIVMVKKLIDICESSGPHSSGEVLEWHRWGPSATRWMPTEISDAGDLCVFGSRMVVWEKMEQYKRLAMLDFNPRNLGRDSLCESAEGWSVIREPSTFSDPYSELKVISSLPYRKAVSGRLPYYTVDLDGMNLICREQGDDLQVLSLTGEEAEPDDKTEAALSFT